MKNCIDCRCLKAKIPLVPVKVKTKFKTFCDIGIDYARAKVTCINGMLTKEAKKGEVIKDKVFKRVLVNKSYRVAAFNAANKCPFYESMNDDE